LGSAFDGSHGVDSEDILNIPEIGMGSFQYFPDQNQYGANDPNLPPVNNTVQQGLDWVRAHADNSRLFGKPVSMSGFGAVTQQNSQAFTPFNSSTAPFASDCPTTGCVSARDLQPQMPVLTPEQQLDAYRQWIQAAVLGGISGIIHYQWTQPNLTAQAGTTISPDQTQTPVSSDVTQTNTSPNDGYGGEDTAALSSIIQQFAPDFENGQGVA
jgi:mannan endo-1,4-beta-mannosidase